MKDQYRFKNIVIFALAVILVLWGLNFLLLFLVPTNRGTFGDMFGAVNALFSGLAFAGIILTIYLQRTELSLQRDELKETRKEFSQQNFESTFFNLLKNQQEIGNKISADTRFINRNSVDIDHIKLSGLEFFQRSKTELALIFSALKADDHHVYDCMMFSGEQPVGYEPDGDNEEYDFAVNAYTVYNYGINLQQWEAGKEYDEFNVSRLAYVFFFRKYHFVISHYFRHLYHIFKYLSDSQNEELSELIAEKSGFDGLAEWEGEVEKVELKYRNYAQFVQAQLSSYELFLLYYNSLAFPKMKALLLKYNILENLSLEDLIDMCNVIPELNIKNRRSMFDFSR